MERVVLAVQDGVDDVVQDVLQGVEDDLRLRQRLQEWLRLSLLVITLPFKLLMVQ